MNRFYKIVIRCNAGMQYGLGHLSRCITIAKEFEDIAEIIFVVKTDSEEFVKQYMKLQNTATDSIHLYFLTQNTDLESEIDLVSNQLISQVFPALLVLDHYEIDENYQGELRKRNIHWLQLDSHGKMNFYADWVLHGSPAATVDLYKPLVKNEKTQLLLGVKYAIIKPEVVQLRKKIAVREVVNNIIVSFGGGFDSGATKTILRFLKESELKNCRIRVTMNSNNMDYEDVIKLLKLFRDAEILNKEELSLEMAKSDLAIITPSMTSYEAACLGLPMVLICTADNQFINAKGWSETGCAINLGYLPEMRQSFFSDELEKLYHSSDTLKRMSQNCLNSVDGLGTKRLKEVINNTIF